MFSVVFLFCGWEVWTQFLHLLWVKHGLTEVQGKQIQKAPRTDTEFAGAKFLLDVIELVQ